MKVVRRRQQQQQQPSTITVGQNIADYELLIKDLKKRGYTVIDRQGRGASAVVFRAETENKRGTTAVVAIKVLSGKDAAACWAREVAALRKLAPAKCPHVPRLLDCFAWTSADAVSFHALVTPFYDGGTLRDLLNRRGPLSERTCTEIFPQLVEAVAVAHAAGIAHCDIKAENILLTSTRDVVLCDWGLCELEEPQRCMVTRGTMAYASPELARQMIERHRINRLPSGEREARNAERLSRRKPYDALACDSWALGLMLWIMATGRHPFDANTNEEIYRRITRSRNILAAEQAAQPENANLWEVIDNLMPEKPEQRWLVRC